MSTVTLAAVAHGRTRRTRRRALVLGALLAALVLAVSFSLIYGNTIYSPAEVLGVILGHDVPGASFTVGRLRLPRVVLAVLVGFCFGLGGVSFQTMLRNPLASPDIIGISSGASAAAAFAIIVLSLDGAGVSLFAVVGALAVSVAIYLLSYRSGVSGTRLVLVGIGVAAMMHSVTTYLISRAANWDLQEAMRWLTGSLNGSTWAATWPVLAAMAIGVPLVLGQSRSLATLQMGDDAASALGVRTSLTRLVIMVAAVGIIAFATAAAGPIAFVAFLAGPIAARLLGPGQSLLIPAGLTGALLVVVADLAGQYLFDTRFPVGVVTGVLGAPYLIYLIIRTNRTGGAL
ncbi:MAG: FecCD family ABC transporter permease [Micrococcaceae bacterium]